MTLHTFQDGAKREPPLSHQLQGTAEYETDTCQDKEYDGPVTCNMLHNMEPLVLVSPATQTAKSVSVKSG